MWKFQKLMKTRCVNQMMTAGVPLLRGQNSFREKKCRTPAIRKRVGAIRASIDECSLTSHNKRISGSASFCPYRSFQSQHQIYANVI